MLKKWVKKNKWKILFVGCCIVFSYTFVYTAHIKFSISGYTTPTVTLFSESGHWLGFGVLGYVMGWPILLLAIADELLQLFLKDRIFDMLDIGRNLGGGMIGLIVRQFFYITIRRRK